MSLLNDTRDWMEYRYIPKNKLPHRITFHSIYSTHYYVIITDKRFKCFVSEFCRTEIVPWLRENIGLYDDHWRWRITSKKVFRFWEPVKGHFTFSTSRKFLTQDRTRLWFNTFYFRDEDDAALFLLTWN